MKVLFVSSGNRNAELNPVVLNQAQSLSREGLEISYFGVRGKGLRGYLENVVSLRKELKMIKPDVVHAHYVLSGVIAKLAGAKPLLVSLMGSDIKGSHWQRMLSYLFARYFWDGCIVKTAEMKGILGIDSVHVIPNGVDMDHFRPEPREKALKVTCWDPEDVNILFPSDPERPEKNFRLAEEALSVLGDTKIKLNILKNVQRDKVVSLLNASDAVLLTSKWEGSPNIIKEAMACNIPVVSTRVGDVEEIFNGTDGCYLTGNNAEEIGRALKLAIAKKRTDGRNRISHLDSVLVAREIIKIYSDLVIKRTK